MCVGKKTLKKLLPVTYGALRRWGFQGTNVQFTHTV